MGINAAERGQEYYQEAKVFLEELILNKTVKLEFGKDKYDKYNRLLAYVFLDEENINLRLIKKGFANFYFPSGKDIYYENFKKAWEDCIKENINLCEKSGDKCAGCIEILKFKGQTVVFRNMCDFDCELTGWEIKDEGRKTFIFENFVLGAGKEVSIEVGEGINTEDVLFWMNEDYVWTNTGDTLFLRDDEGLLVLWEEY